MSRLKGLSTQLLSIIFFATTGESFNVNTKNPIIASAPVTDQSLFGYSVALGNNQLYVGAPAHNTRGAVFRCDFRGTPNERTICSQIEKSSQFSRNNSKNGDFLGASVVVLESGEMVTCAPRESAEDYLNPGYSMGACYRYSPRSRLISMDQLFTTPTPGGYRGWDLFTMISTSMITGDSGKVIVGLPLARTKEFTFANERHPGHVMEVDVSSGGEFYLPINEVPWQKYKTSTAQEPHTYDLVGTSIAKGRFFYDKKDSHYVVGAPKANNLYGRIYICPDCFEDFSRVRLRIRELSELKVDGDQFGSRFGETVCAIDIDGNGFDDLVVGAPLFSQENGLSDVGNVYVYKTVIIGHSTTFELITSSLIRQNYEKGMRFGSALANLGDLDGDGFEDFAIGAPYEGNGAVYIYRGSEFFSFEDSPQRITTEDLNVPLRGFGASFSSSSDVDDNGTPDFAVGSMESDKVMLLRTRQVVRLFPSSSYNIPLGAVNPALNEFRIDLTPKLLMDATADLWITITFLNVDERIILPNDLDSQRTLKTIFQKGTLEKKISNLTIQSKNHNFGVNMANLSSVPKPIRFNIKLEWTLVNSECDDCPLLDPRSNNVEFLRFTIQLQSGCKDVNRCECRVRLEPPDQSSIQVTVGRDTDLSTKIKLINEGTEPSYDNRLTIRFDKEIMLPREFQCFKEESSNAGEARPEHILMCSLPNVGPGLTREIPLTFDVRQFSGRTDLTTITMTMNLNTKCAKPDPNANDEAKILVTLDYKYEIVIKSDSKDKLGEQRIYSVNQTKLPFLQSYSVKNLGPSPLQQPFKFKIFVPSLTFLSHDVSKTQCPVKGITSPFNTGIPGISTRSKSALISCATSQCIVYDCEVQDGLEAGKVVTIDIQMYFNATDARKNSEVNSYSIRTLVRKWTSSSVEDFVFSTTELNSSKADSQAVIAKWAFIVGSIIGLLLLAGLILLLWKSNSFSKMRVYKNRMEEDQSLARNSARQANGQDQDNEREGAKPMLN